MLRFAISLGLLLLATSAWAQQRVGLIARSGGDPPLSSAEAVRAVSRALGPGVDLIVEPRPEGAAVRKERLRPFAAALAISDQGWRAYKKVEPAFAESRLAQARTTALQVLDLPGGAELVAEISLRLGAVRLYRGRPSEADEDFGLAARLDPDLPVTVAEFRPAVVEAYRRATETARARARIVLEVSADAAVEVDGAAWPGTGARRELEVAVGVHALVVRSPGRAAVNQLVVIPAGGDRVAISASEADERSVLGDQVLQLGSPEGDSARQVAALLAFAELDALLLVAPVWRRGGPALLGQRCSGAAARCTAVQEVGFSPGGVRTAADALLSRLRGAPLRFPPTLLVDERLVRGDSRPGVALEVGDTPWWQRSWVWLGVAGVALGVTSYFILTGDVSTNTSLGYDSCDFGGACR